MAKIYISFVASHFSPFGFLICKMSRLSQNNLSKEMSMPKTATVLSRWSRMGSRKATSGCWSMLSKNGFDQYPSLALSPSVNHSAVR